MRNGDSTRELILKATDKLIYEKGFNNTAFGDIEKATGLSRGNITYHFRTKKKILEEVIDGRLVEIRSSLEAMEESGAHPSEALVRFCEMIIGNRASIRKYGCPIGSLSIELAKCDADLYKAVRPMFQTYCQWLEKQYRRLGQTDGAARESALSMLARVQGVAVVAQTFRDNGFLQRELQGLMAQIKNDFSDSPIQEDLP